MSSRACPNCGSNHIEHHDATGASVCTECGVVLEENAIVSSVEFVEGAGGASSMVGQFVSATSSKAYSNSQGAGRGGYGFSRDSRETTLANGRRKIMEVASRLRLGGHYVDAAHRLFTIAVEKNFVQGRRTLHVVASCLYISCRQEKSQHMLIDFSDALQVNVYTLGTCFLKFRRLLGLKLEILDPALYVYRFAAHLDLDDKANAVALTALRLVGRMKRDWIVAGRRPAGICAAALLIAARAHGFSRQPQDVTRILRVCGMTVSTRVKEFELTPSATLTMDQFNRVELETEADPPIFTRNRIMEARARAIHQNNVELLQSGALDNPMESKRQSTKWRETKTKKKEIEFEQIYQTIEQELANSLEGKIAEGADKPDISGKTENEEPNNSGKTEEYDEHDKGGKTNEGIESGKSGKCVEDEEPDKSCKVDEDEQPSKNGKVDEDEQPDKTGKVDEDEQRSKDGKVDEDEEPNKNGEVDEGEEADKIGKVEEPDKSGKIDEDEEPDNHGNVKEDGNPSKNEEIDEDQNDAVDKVKVSSECGGTEGVMDGDEKVDKMRVIALSILKKTGSDVKRLEVSKSVTIADGQLVEIPKQWERAYPKSRMGKAIILPDQSIPEERQPATIPNEGKLDTKTWKETMPQEMKDDVESIFRDPTEIAQKEAIFNKINKDYIELQAQKDKIRESAEEAENQDEIDMVEQAQGLARYRKRKNRGRGNAETTEEALMQAVANRKISRKINYDAMSAIFDDAGSFSTAGGTAMEEEAGLPDF